jgi:hypothetical protein
LMAAWPDSAVRGAAILEWWAFSWLLGCSFHAQEK